MNRDIDYYKDEIHCLYAEKKELQERIISAIKYIEHYNLEGVMLNCQYWYDCLIDLLDILKGSDIDE